MRHSSIEREKKVESERKKVKAIKTGGITETKRGAKTAEAATVKAISASEVTDTKAVVSPVNPNATKTIIHEKASAKYKDAEPKPNKSEFIEGQKMSAVVTVQKDAGERDSSNRELIAEKAKVHELIGRESTKEKDATDNTDAAVDSEASPIQLESEEQSVKSHPAKTLLSIAAETPDMERDSGEVQHTDELKTKDFIIEDIQEKSKERKRDINRKYDIRVKELNEKAESDIETLRNKQSKKIEEIRNSVTEHENRKEYKKLHYSVIASSANVSQKKHMESAVEKGVVRLHSTHDTMVTVLLQSLKPKECSFLRVELESDSCECFDFHIYIR